MSSPTSTGKVDFKVGSVTYQTCYKVFGDLKNGKHRPLVALHGGPGMSHHYMLSHKILHEKHGIPVLFYDQIGNGESSHCIGVPPEFWTPELFMDELDNLCRVLGICDDFDVLGHSWGGMLGAQYAATKQPKGLKRLIIANSPASLPLMAVAVEELLNKFPEDYVAMIRRHNAEGTWATKEFQDAAMMFYKKHTCILDPWPEDLLESFRNYAANPTVYTTMLGPCEFVLIGSLKDWSIIDIIHKISCPTLLISSPNDEIQEFVCRPFFSKIEKIKWVEFQNSTHVPVFEEPERYFEVIVDFLNTTEVLATN